MKKLVLLIAMALVLTAGFTIVLTARYAPSDFSVPPAQDVAIPSGAAERLARAIRIRTSSAEDEAAFNAAAFADLHWYLQSAFPLAHSHLRREAVATHSLLYTWPGSEYPGCTRPDFDARMPSRTMYSTNFAAVPWNASSMSTADVRSSMSKR